MGQSNGLSPITSILSDGRNKKDGRGIPTFGKLFYCCNIK